MRALALAVLLTGCAHQITAYPEQPPVVSPINRGIEAVTLTIRWHDSVDSVDDACKGTGHGVLYGCARVEIKNGLACTVNAMPPKDFNDVPRLAVLGHEVAHCFLMQHR